jgi:hypothetical protein
MIQLPDKTCDSVKIFVHQGCPKYYCYASDRAIRLEEPCCDEDCPMYGSIIIDIEPGDALNEN